jgi:hypothetical protein
MKLSRHILDAFHLHLHCLQQRMRKRTPPIWPNTHYCKQAAYQLDNIRSHSAGSE